MKTTGESGALLRMVSSWGELLLRALGGRIVSCDLPVLRSEPGQPFAWGAVLWSGEPAKADRVALQRGMRYVRLVFSGRPESPPPFQWPAASPFTLRVWKALTEIPAGGTLRYGELATRVRRPGGARAVGRACGANPLPLFIPCHRVLPADGSLGGFSSGLPWKRLLLDREAQAIRRRRTSKRKKTGGRTAP